MQQIETEFDSERIRAERLARRSEIMARVRTGVGVVLIMGVIGAVYAFRGDIESFVSARVASSQAEDLTLAGGPAQAQAKPSTPKAAAAASIQKAQENAKTRDALIDGLAK